MSFPSKSVTLAAPWTGITQLATNSSPATALPLTVTTDLHWSDGGESNPLMAPLVDSRCFFSLTVNHVHAVFQLSRRIKAKTPGMEQFDTCV